MARGIMAGAVLALLALAVGLTVGVGERADATVTYDGFRNIGNYAEMFSDTTNATIGDSIVFDCEKVYRWSISAGASSNDILYKFKIAGRDSVTGAGYIEALVGIEQEWEVAPSWVKVQSAASTARYTIRVQGYEAGEAGRGTISDTTKVF